MIRIPPGRVHYLSNEELADYNFLGFDPFHEEAYTAKEALELGMTKSNYLEYQSNTHNTASECGAAVGRGDILPEEVWQCVGQKLKELQEFYRQRSK